MDQAILANYLASLGEHGIPGCDCVVYKDHRQIFRKTCGYADSGRTRPVTNTNTYWLFSATKLITCTAVMQLVEKGSLNLDQKVSDYLPEYENLKVRDGAVYRQAKNAMTIRHLLSMQSGLNYNTMSLSIRKVTEDTGWQATTRQMVAALSNEPLDFEPGTRFQYSFSHDVLGAVIEEVSGLRLGAYLDKYVFTPLGMENTGFELTSERKANLADLFEYDRNTMSSIPVTSGNPFPAWKNFESGGGGLISTVDDYILFLDAMCNDGMSADGYRILSRQSIDLMRTDQLHSVSKEDFHKHFGKEGYSYGLGVRTLIEKEKSGAPSPFGEFGWDSAGGAYALIDVQNHLAIFYMQHVLKCHDAYGVIHPKIRDLTYKMLEGG